MNVFRCLFALLLKLGLAVVVVLLLAPSGELGHAAENSGSVRGLSSISAVPVVRVQAPDAAAGKTWLYQVALPLQVSSTQAAIFANVREALAQGVDFEVGNDVLVFGSLAELATAKPIVVNRNHDEPNPNSVPANQPATMVKYPVRGGFVPLGAKRGDGTPHPHAGTGFGLSMVQAWKIPVPGPPPYLQNSYADAESYGYWEFQQFAFDGAKFQVTNTQRVPFDKLFADWRISNGGMTNAIADGDDLLVTVVAKSRSRETARFNGSGVLRMRREDGAWRAVSLDPITPLSSTIEPSLVRDLDGTLLASARGSGDRHHDICICRSTDGGRTWTKIIESLGLVSAAPITLNQAADGTPFIAANLKAVIPGPRDPLTLLAQQRKIAIEPGLNSRNTLTLWPLNEQRTALAATLQVLDCRAEFGPPVGSNWSWRIDHPSGMTVRLADEKWHHLLGARVQDYREIKVAMPPTARTGMYVYEVFSTGAPHPVWKF